MNAPHGPDPVRTDAGAAWTPSLGFLAIAVGAVLGALAWWWTAPAPAVDALPAAAPPPATVQFAPAVPVPVPPPPVAVTAGVAPPALPPAAAPAPTPRIPRLRDPDGDQTPDLADYVNDGERPTMSEVIARLNRAGVTTGLGAFAPPGTRPPMVGIAVPEDFELPDGYVRHHQATDDGERIEPILMFAPDRQFVDAAGQPIAIPADRVVPPEMAPAGLPIRRIAIPARADPGMPGS